MKKTYIKVPKVGTRGYIRFKNGIRQCVVVGGICHTDKNSVTLLIRIASDHGAPHLIHCDKGQFEIFPTSEDCRKSTNPLRLTRYRHAAAVVAALFGPEEFSWDSSCPWSVSRFKWNGERPTMKRFRLPDEFLLTRDKANFLTKPDFGEYTYCTAYECKRDNLPVVNFPERKKDHTVTITFE